MKKTLTAKQWEATLARLDLNPTHRAISHDVLVEGRPQKDVATQRRLTRGAISQIVNRVWRAHVAHGALTPGLPNGWRQITVALPDREATLVEAMARLAQRAASPP